jgi:murein DD-endopeptidase MepM/ murein hydrolase activator NlpD
LKKTSKTMRANSVRVMLRGLCAALLLAGCTAVGASPQAATLVVKATSPPALTATTQPTGTPTGVPTASPSPTPAASPTLRAATPTPVFALCSPLEDITLAEMGQPDLLKNPFELPRPGMDDGHFGADFAYWSRGTHKAMLGLPVLAALSGRVVGIVPNRQPYGNAVIIETALDAVPADWLRSLPTPAPTVQPAANLYCPPDPAAYPSQGSRSLYLLYAHLNKAPLVSLNQQVTCGQAIGEVGTTGRSVNPHLHLETRVGPAGATFPVMAHYDNAATDSEMATYCTWRVSGLFQAFDPLKLLALQP